MIFTDITIWGVGKSLENMFEGKLSVKGGIARALTAPIFASFAAVLFDSVVPGCTQKTQSFVLAPRSVSISLPVEEFQEPELITGTTGFAQFTLPYGLELTPMLSYVYAVLGQPAPPESYSLTASLSLNLSYQVAGQPVGPESYSLAVSPGLTYTSQVTGQPITPITVSLTLSPRLQTPYRVYTSVTETVSASTGTTTPTNVSESVSASTGTTTPTNVSESVSASTGTTTPNTVTNTTYAGVGTQPGTPESASLTASPSLTYTYSVS
jgi:hypothetical protein